MLLTISTEHKPASDLGFLLHKHPDRFQSFDLSFGQAHVFYPEVTADRCTVCLLLDVDPVGLVRGHGRDQSFLLWQYVNDRPFVASSFLSVAIAQVFGTAMGGRCKDRPDLVSTPIPLTARLDVLPVRGGDRPRASTAASVVDEATSPSAIPSASASVVDEATSPSAIPSAIPSAPADRTRGLVHYLFEPLGYAVEAVRHPLDERFPEWGASPYYSVTIRGTTTLASLLTHLYVLVPVFDNDKHYFVGEDELEKLLAKAGGWLAGHPEKEEIARRYLRHRSSLYRQALARLVEEEEVESTDDQQTPAQAEETLETPLRLNDQRLGAVMAALRASGARSVVDLGCGEGKLLRELLQDRQFERIVGMDVSIRSLELARKRLRLDRLPDRQASRLELIHGSLMYRDQRLAGFDAAAIVEVIEHLDPPRLSAMERVVFEFARPQTVVLTTPNREYNAIWETLPAGQFRHADHRFEWTRVEFQDWATGIASRFGYSVRFLPVGPEHPTHGSPTHMGVFQRG